MLTLPSPTRPIQPNGGINPLSDKVILTLVAAGVAAAANGGLAAFVVVVLTTGVLMTMHAAPQVLVEYQRGRRNDLSRHP